MASDEMTEEEGAKAEASDETRASSPAADEVETSEAKKRRKRAKLTLRIPDDEVARPKEPAKEAAPEPKAEIDENAETRELPAVVIAASPIIQLGVVTGPEAEHLVRAQSSFPPPPPPAADLDATPIVPPVAPPPAVDEIEVAVEEDVPVVEPARDTEIALPPVPTGEIRVPSDLPPAATEEIDVIAAAPPPLPPRRPSRPPPAEIAPPPPRRPSVPPPNELPTPQTKPTLIDGERAAAAAAAAIAEVSAEAQASPAPAAAAPVAVAPPVAPPAAAATAPLKHLSDPPRPMAQAILDFGEAKDAPAPSDREGTPLDAEDVVSIESARSAAGAAAAAGAVAAAAGAAAAASPTSGAPPSPPKKPVTPAATQTQGAPATPRTPSDAPAAQAGQRAPLVIVPQHANTPSPLAPPHAMAEGTAQRRRGRPWWEDLFNDDFIRTMAKITDEQIAREVDFIEDSLGVARGGALLDLACGTGRHSIELSRRGYQVVGLDLSLAMLARAGDEAQDRGQKLNFVHGDMREMTFEETFDGIFCWNTSFGFFEEEKNAQVIARVHRALRTGGQFLLDVANRDFVAHQSPSLVWFEGDGCICMDEMQVDFITSRMKVKRTMMMDDGRTREIDYSVRIYSLHELGKMLHDHGFRVAEVSGATATPGVFFGTASQHTFILAEKR